MPGSKPCEVGCRCGHHPQGKLPPERQEQRKRERDAARDRRAYNAQQYWANPEGHREAARVRRAAAPERAREMDRRSRMKNRDKRMARDRARQPVKRLRKHGMSVEDFAQMWAVQEGCCCYCGGDLPRDPKQVHIDHDHACCPPGSSCSACRRGLACQMCNTAIGSFQDDPDLMIRVANVLRAKKAETRQRISGKPVQGELFPNVVPLERREETG